MPCCCSFTTREHESAKHCRYGALIFDWKSRDKCVCSAKAERNGSVPSGLKLHRLFVGSCAAESLMITSSGTLANNRSHGMVSHICCGNTCGLRLSTLPHYESDASLHMLCATVVQLRSCRQASMCP